jgi:hypothetical protein
MLNTLARGMYLLFLAVLLVSWAATAGKSDQAQPKGHSAVVVYMFT